MARCIFLHLRDTMKIFSITVYRIPKPLYGMPSAGRAWHTTMSTFLVKKGCATVGFEKSMCTVTIGAARILLGAHIDNFVIAYANQQVLDAFRVRLLDAFEGTYDGCEVTRDTDKSITVTYLSRTHYNEEILRTYNFWNATPRLTPMQPNTRLDKVNLRSRSFHCHNHHFSLLVSGCHIINILSLTKVVVKRILLRNSIDAMRHCRQPRISCNNDMLRPCLGIF